LIRCGKIKIEEKIAIFASLPYSLSIIFFLYVIFGALRGHVFGLDPFLMSITVIGSYLLALASCIIFAAVLLYLRFMKNMRPSTLQIATLIILILQLSAPPIYFEYVPGLRGLATFLSHDA
jgi:hypothetical protein